MNPRVTEIFARLDAINLAESELRAERVVLHAELQEILEAKEKTDWTTAFKGQNGEILSAIWNAPKHRLSSIKICTLAWGNGAVSKNAFNGTLKRVRKALEKAGCGYILKAIKSDKTGEVIVAVTCSTFSNILSLHLLLNETVYVLSSSHCYLFRVELLL